jgi:hypothetical protein
MKTAASIPVLAAFLCAPAAYAAEEQTALKPTPDTEKTISVNWENDVFSGTDGNYTNGIRVAVVSAENDVPHWLDVAADALPFFDVSGAKRWEFAFGQNIYTPQFYETSAPQPDDRPYAGWLYGSAGVISDTGTTLDVLQITLGVVGPASGAEQVQETVHDLIGSPHPLGWQYQLENEPGIIVSYERKWRNLWQINPNGYGFDLTPSAGASVGNILTQASVGTVVRFGQDLPADYGPPLIGSNLAGTDYFAPSKDLGWYVFAGLEGNAVARNIFLDGNTFQDSPSVDKRNFVGGLQAGLALTYDGVRYAYTQSFRTKEYDTQDGGTSYGAFTVSWKF